MSNLTKTNPSPKIIKNNKEAFFRSRPLLKSSIKNSASKTGLELTPKVTKISSNRRANSVDDDTKYFKSSDQINLSLDENLIEPEPRKDKFGDDIEVPRRSSPKPLIDNRFKNDSKLLAPVQFEAINQNVQDPPEISALKVSSDNIKGILKKTSISFSDEKRSYGSEWQESPDNRHREKQKVRINDINDIYLKNTGINITGKIFENIRDNLQNKIGTLDEYDQPLIKDTYKVFSPSRVYSENSQRNTTPLAKKSNSREETKSSEYVLRFKQELDEYIDIQGLNESETEEVSNFDKIDIKKAIIEETTPLDLQIKQVAVIEKPKPEALILESPEFPKNEKKPLIKKNHQIKKPFDNEGPIPNVRSDTDIPDLQIRDLKSQLTSKENAIKTRDQQLTSTKTEVRELKLKNEQLRNTVGVLEEEYKLIREDLDQYKKSNLLKDQKLNDAEQKIHSLILNQDSYKNEIIKFNKEVKVLECINNDYKTEIVKLESFKKYTELSLRENDLKIEDLEQKLSQKNDEKLLELIEEKNTFIKDLKISNENLKNQYESLKEYITKKEKNFQEQLETQKTMSPRPKSKRSIKSSRSQAYIVTEPSKCEDDADIAKQLRSNQIESNYKNKKLEERNKFLTAENKKLTENLKNKTIEIEHTKKQLTELIKKKDDKHTQNSVLDNQKHLKRDLTNKKKIIEELKDQNMSTLLAFSTLKDVLNSLKLSNKERSAQGQVQESAKRDANLIKVHELILKVEFLANIHMELNSEKYIANEDFHQETLKTGQRADKSQHQNEDFFQHNKVLQVQNRALEKQNELLINEEKKRSSQFCELEQQLIFSKDTLQKANNELKNLRYKNEKFSSVGINIDCDQIYAKNSYLEAEHVNLKKKLNDAEKKLDILERERSASKTSEKENLLKINQKSPISNNKSPVSNKSYKTPKTDKSNKSHKEITISTNLVDKKNTLDDLIKYMEQSYPTKNSPKTKKIDSDENDPELIETDRTDLTSIYNDNEQIDINKQIEINDKSVKSTLTVIEETNE